MTCVARLGNKRLLLYVVMIATSPECSGRDIGDLKLEDYLRPGAFVFESIIDALRKLSCTSMM